MTFEPAGKETRVCLLIQKHRGGTEIAVSDLPSVHLGPQ